MNSNKKLLTLLFLIFALINISQCNEQEDHHQQDSPTPEDKLTDEEKEHIRHQQEQWGPLGGALLANIFSEFGDKTFIIAAIMAIKYSRLTVFLGAAGALIFMTFLACAVGNYLPALLSPNITSFIAAVILTVFGCKMLYEAYTGDDGDSDEEKEIEQEMMEIEHKLEQKKSSNSPLINNNESASPTKQQQQKQQQQIPFLSKKNLYIWATAFSQVFFGEWGDRSQITTLVLASDNDAFLVFIGASIGQALCTVLAVLGGRLLAKSVSEKYLNIGGGILMLLFAIHSYMNAFD